MDHLPTPIDGHIPRVIMYAEAKSTFYPEDFFTLPSKWGYANTLELVEHGLGSKINDRKVNEFLQSWLFFALLAQILNRPIENEKFRYGEAEVHTEPLSQMIKDAVQNERAQTELKATSRDVRFQWSEGADDRSLHGVSRVQKNRWFRANMALEQASRFISKHCSYKRFAGDGQPTVDLPSPIPDEKIAEPRANELLVLSIAILGETLQQARPRAVSLSQGPLQFFRDHDDKETTWGYSPFCRKTMRESGYCPLEIRRMESSIPSVSILYYACFIKKDNRTTHSTKCTASACKSGGHRLDPLHMKASCQQENSKRSCDTAHIENRETRLKEMIDNEQIPLVKFTAGKLELQGYPLKEELPQFGVMSHSWEEAIVHCKRDASGGDDRNMLECQVETLQKTFNKIHLGSPVITSQANIPFYVDVLCMPKQPTARAKTINQLKHIYHRASAVLVWDRNLLERQYSGDIFETSMRIRAGDWITRLWTFQEIILARNGTIHIAFDKETTISVSDMRDERAKVRENLMDNHHYVRRAGHPFSKAIRDLRKKPEHRVERAWEAVQYRQISNADDETIVLASVLGMDVATIQKINESSTDRDKIADKRMAMFLQMLDTTPGLGIPSGLIFLPGSKLSVEGFEWAPSTWLTKHLHPHKLLSPIGQAATLMRGGALVRFPGILLHCPNKGVEQSTFWFPVHESMHKWFKVKVDVKPERWAQFWQGASCPDNPDNPEPAIILCNGDARNKWEVGVLVKSNGFLRRGEIRLVELLSRVWIRLETNPKVISDWISNMQKHSDHVMFGERLGFQQEWCVGGRPAVSPCNSSTAQ